MNHLLPLPAVVATLLASCATGPEGDLGPGSKVSASLVAGADGKLDGRLDMDHLVGGRVQVRRAIEEFPALEVGLRLGLSDKEFSKTESGDREELQGIEVNAAPSIRYNFPTAESSRWSPYVEGFVGYGHTFARSEVSSSTGTLSERDDGGGLFGGIGAGVEYAALEDVGVHLGLEHTWSDYDFGAGVDLDERELIGLIGVTFTF